MPPERRRQMLTDEDRAVIADLIWMRVKNDLYVNAGKGIVNIIWRLLLLGLLAIAMYGYSKNWFSM